MIYGNAQRFLKKIRIMIIHDYSGRLKTIHDNIVLFIKFMRVQKDFFKINKSSQFILIHGNL